MSEIKSLIDDDIKEDIDHSVICVKFAMMSKQIKNKDKEIERLNNIINELEKSIDISLKEFDDNKDYFIDETTLKDLKNELQELKGSE